METQEFKYQLFKTPKQWESGLFYRLNLSKDRQKQKADISLYTVPSFEMWIKGIEGASAVEGLSISECGLIYFIKEYKLYQYDSKNGLTKEIKVISGQGNQAGEIELPVTTLLDQETFWIIESTNSRIQAFSKETFQIKYIIDALEEPISIAIGEEEKLYILDKTSKEIVVYEKNGISLKDSFGKKHLEEPIGLAVGRDCNIYVIDNSYPGFVQFSASGEFLTVIGDFKNQQPALIAIDQKGNIFTAKDQTNVIRQYDSDGSFIAEIMIPDVNNIYDIHIDVKDDLYVCTDQGIAYLTAEDKVTKEIGTYYAKVLDSGIEKCQWHRLSTVSEFPEKSIFEIYYFASDDNSKKEGYENILKEEKISLQKKREKLEKYMVENDIKWEHDHNNSPGDMLFQNANGRYLWIKIEMATYDENIHPKLKEVKIIYPRISYLRYLPAIYQEDSKSKEFLERFLSLFESVFYDLETNISHLYKYFDPKSVPPEFLSWLGSWINRALEEEWDEDTQRRFISRAFELYKSKGTSDGIKKSIELYLNCEEEPNKVAITEYQEMIKPMILTENGMVALGVNTLLFEKPIQKFKLGSDAILGKTALWDSAQSEEAFHTSIAYSFTVILNLTQEEREKYEKGLIKLIEEEKPAYTSCTLRFANDSREMGLWTYVGVNSKVDDYHLMELGKNAVLGENLVSADTKGKGGKVESRSRIGSPDDYLI